MPFVCISTRIHWKCDLSQQCSTQHNETRCNADILVSCTRWDIGRACVRFGIPVSQNAKEALQNMPYKPIRGLPDMAPQGKVKRVIADKSVDEVYEVTKSFFNPYVKVWKCGCDNSHPRWMTVVTTSHSAWMLETFERFFWFVSQDNIWTAQKMCTTLIETSVKVLTPHRHCSRFTLIGIWIFIRCLRRRSTASANQHFLAGVEDGSCAVIIAAWHCSQSNSCWFWFDVSLLEFIFFSPRNYLFGTCSCSVNRIRLYNLEMFLGLSRYDNMRPMTLGDEWSQHVPVEFWVKGCSQEALQSRILKIIWFLSGEESWFGWIRIRTCVDWFSPIGWSAVCNKQAVGSNWC